MDDFIAVVSYPKIKASDYKWIDEYRKAHDYTYDLIDLHLSFVFPVFDFDEKEFIEEIKLQSKGSSCIDFRVKCAIRNNDLTSDYWHVLLAPDRGFSEVVKLHDKLYSGILKELERLDLDFIPHMGIANSKDPKECKRMMDEINARNIDVEGRIEQLEVVRFGGGEIGTVEVI